MLSRCFRSEDTVEADCMILTGHQGEYCKHKNINNPQKSYFSTLCLSVFYSVYFLLCYAYSYSVPLYIFMPLLLATILPLLTNSFMKKRREKNLENPSHKSWWLVSLHCCDCEQQPHWLAAARPLLSHAFSSLCVLAAVHGKCAS